MKTRERTHIRSHLQDLIRLTDCSNPLLIAHLYSKNILNDFDKAELAALNNKLVKSTRFYEIIVTRANSYSELCQSLEEQAQTGALAILRMLQIGDDEDDKDEPDEDDSGQEIKKGIRFNVRSPVTLFTGREEELTKLHLQITQNKGQVTVVTHIAAITGLGGIGKTELCRKYIEKYSNFYDGNVIWIGSEKHAELLKSFRILAKDYLGISLKDVDGEEKEIETVVNEVYAYFENKKCLFVFDNAVSSEDEQLDIFLPCNVENHKKPHVLITSRDREWAMGIPTNTLFLESLKENEAIEFIKKGLSISDNDTSQDKAIEKLVRKLQYFPLALQQALSFIQQQSLVRAFGIKAYLSLFEKNSGKLLNSKIAKALINSYSQTTLTTWTITTEMIRKDEEDGGKAMTILNLIAYFDPENIPEEVLSAVLNLSGDEFYAALRLLVKYSMVTSNQPQEKSISVHRLVQEVTRIEVQSRGEDENVVGDCLRMFTMNQIISYPSVKQIRTVFEFHRKNKLDFPVRQVVYHVPVWNINWLLVSHNIHSKNFSSAQKAITKLINTLPSDQVESVKGEFQSAFIKFSEGNKYLESLQEFRALLQKLMGEGDLITQNDDGIIYINHYISDILMELGKFEECLELLTRIFNNHKESYTPEKNGMVIKTLGQFAQLFIRMEKFGEAHQVCQEILVISNNINGDEIVLKNPKDFLPWPIPPPPDNPFSAETRERMKSLCEKTLDLAKIELSWEFIGSCILEILMPSGLLELEALFIKDSQNTRNQTEIEADVVKICEKLLSFSLKRLSEVETKYHPEILVNLEIPLGTYRDVYGICDDDDDDEIINKYNSIVEKFKNVASHEEHLSGFRKAVSNHMNLDKSRENNKILDSLVSLQAHTSVIVLNIDCYKDFGLLLSDLENVLEEKMRMKGKGDVGATAFNKSMKELKMQLLHCVLSVGQAYLHLRDAINCMENAKIWPDDVPSQNFTLNSLS